MTGTQADPAALIACGKATKHGPHDDCVGIPLPPVLHPLPEESSMTDTAFYRTNREQVAARADDLRRAHTDIEAKPCPSVCIGQHVPGHPDCALNADPAAGYLAVLPGSPLAQLVRGGNDGPEQVNVHLMSDGTLRWTPRG